jgi:Flp pilus assembly protein TadD
MRPLRSFALALLVSGCAASATTRPAAKVERTETGFAIAEPVRADADVRADFASALRLLEQEQYAEGIALLTKVTEASPELTAAHIDLGMAWARSGDLARAEASLLRALELNPRHPVAHNELGIVYRKTGRFAQARASYERALELQPEFHFARRNLAILCDVYLADPECALANYESYARAVPDDGAAALWIADLHKRLGR